MPQLRLVLLLLLIAAPRPAAACEASFRAGLSHYAALDARLTAVETALYHGIGWVSRGAVLTRLEQRSALTTACQEVHDQRDSLARARASLDRATQSFQLASALCIGENRARAQANLDALSDSARALTDLDGFVASLVPRCAASP